MNSELPKLYAKALRTKHATKFLSIAYGAIFFIPRGIRIPEPNMVDALRSIGIDVTTDAAQRGLSFTMGELREPTYTTAVASFRESQSQSANETETPRKENKTARRRRAAHKKR